MAPRNLGEIPNNDKINAEDVEYAGSATAGLTATNVEDALDQLHSQVVDIQSISSSEGLLSLWDFDGIHHRLDGTPHADDDEFDGDTLDPSWTWVVPTGIGTPATTVEGHALGIAIDGKTGGWTTDFAALMRPISSFAIGSSWQLCHRSGASDQNAWSVGLILSDGLLESSNILGLVMEYTAGDARWCRYSGTFTAATRAELRTSTIGAASERNWLRLVADAANTWRPLGSANGRRFSAFNLIDAGTWAQTLTPTHAGFGFSWVTGRAPTIDIEHFRRIA